MAGGRPDTGLTDAALYCPAMTLLLAALLVGLDQLTKVWVVNGLPFGGRLPVGLGFSITHSRNTGAAFGILQDIRLQLGPVLLDGTLLLGLLSAAVSLGLVIYILKHRGRLDRLSGTALGLVLAGAAGNMIDRLRLGYVVDFIHFKVGSFDFPVFNVADSCVVIGAALLVISSLAGGHDRSTSIKRSPLPRRHQLDEMPELPPLGGRGPNEQ